MAKLKKENLHKLSRSEFSQFLDELAQEAEHNLPGPNEQVKDLLDKRKRRNKRIYMILATCVFILLILIIYGIRNPGDMPLGMGGIFKAYVIGTKAPTPAPGDPLPPKEPRTPPRPANSNR